MTDQATEGLLSPWLRKRRIIAARPYLKGKILDFGCGSGALSVFCHQDEYTGVDIDADVVKIAKNTYPDYHFSTILSDTEYYDTIVSLALIEHIKDPGDLLLKFKRRLNQNGKIILTTPAPAFEWIHDLGAKIGIFSAHANEEHEQLIDYAAMSDYTKKIEMKVEHYQKFLCGGNQLFVITTI